MQNSSPDSINREVKSEKDLEIGDILAALGSATTLTIISKEPEATFEKFCRQFRCVEAAGGVVKSPKGRILMIFRNGLWDLPKGHREVGEEIGQCAVREVEEECGPNGIIIGDEICTTQHFYQAKEEWILKSTAWFAMSVFTKQHLVPQKKEGITKARWCSPARARRRAGKSYATIFHVIKKYFEQNEK